VHHVLPNIPHDRKCKTFLLAQDHPGSIVIGYPVGILTGEPVLPMLPYELVHDYAVQLLLLTPLGQREAIPAGNVGLNANLVFKNLLGQEDEARISETERRSDISLRDMSPGKPRNYCGVLPVLSNELASLPRIEYKNPGLPCLILDEDQR
jgi:hypothetical protein